MRYVTKTMNMKIFPGSYSCTHITPNLHDEKMKHNCQAKSSENEHNTTQNLDSTNIRTADQSRQQHSSRKTGYEKENTLDTKNLMQRHKNAHCK